ncbi:dihydrofolate reductase family protein [Kribbella sp. NPDC048915]|uniref:dihydrofolate reductase family protein n=1 Tax=Kribbella sp. NPDC048915 TaxID=3155148 RepID=UPI003410C836
MRNIVVRLCMSEDGIVEHPEQWLARTSLAQLVSAGGTLLFGRRTFERYAGTLGGLEDTRNLVVGSRPVVRAGADAELLHGDTRRVLTALKSVPGEDLHVIGSLTLMRSLLRWRLVDEFSLLIHPVAASRGTLLDRRQLQLISMCARDGGVLEANYRMRYAATAAPAAALVSTGRWGGTRSRVKVASPARPAARTHA